MSDNEWQQDRWLFDESCEFPETSRALQDPNGLLAAGGELSTDRLINAYSKGIFPWYSDGQPVLWWTPDPRMVLFPHELHLGRSIRKLARKKLFRITVDTAFEEVIHHCAQVIREGEDGTWITPEIKTAYENLYRDGFAHSIEAWQSDRLVGGLYGVSIGRIFYGESMFSLVSGASKIAFATLVQQLGHWQYKCIDCQIYTNYLESFGAREIPREAFESLLLGGDIKGSNAAKPAATQKIYNNFTWQDRWQMPEHGFD